MKFERPSIHWLLICGCLALASCTSADWRPQAIALAETTMREDTADPSAQFSHEQVTGDQQTGQTCGFVTAKFGRYGLAHTARFIVYIDGGAGPYVEANLGKYSISQQNFDRAWQADCVTEGYTS